MKTLKNSKRFTRTLRKIISLSQFLNITVESTCFRCGGKLLKAWAPVQNVPFLADSVRTSGIKISKPLSLMAVSYTHLTLPTKRIV